jgi:D-alanine-D-alanine ligase
MKILVASGGISAEREISLLSGKAVLEAGKSAGHDMTFYDWDGTEEWLLTNAKNFDVILPIQHGTGSEDGVIQAILEKTGVPFLGSDSKVSAVCFDKAKTLEVYKTAGIKVPSGDAVTILEYETHPLRSVPHILKPISDGSSVGVIRVKDPKHVDKDQISAAFGERKSLMLEELIIGDELTVPVLEGKKLPIIKIVPPLEGDFDYENKYNGKSQEIVSPSDISLDLQEKARILGERIHDILGCRHLSRTDIMVREGAIYVLETNTMPGMTNQSLFPKAAAAAGLDYPGLVDYFVRLCLGEV